MNWWLLVLGLEFPVLLALIDCANRNDDHFPGGHEDKRAWVRWLIVAVITVPVFLGYGILLGYWFVIVKRNSPAAP